MAQSTRQTKLFNVDVISFEKRPNRNFKAIRIFWQIEYVSQPKVHRSRKAFRLITKNQKIAYTMYKTVILFWYYLGRYEMQLTGIGTS